MALDRSIRILCFSCGICLSYKYYYGPWPSRHRPWTCFRQHFHTSVCIYVPNARTASDLLTFISSAAHIVFFNPPKATMPAVPLRRQTGTLLPQRSQSW
ncbi:hypothetical protein PILCRDRAFT_375032 [Piloderma croceum F 1598]|uniref:Uncharacterized protein n=1 Tax=Piloderma croceum (strain F 1598) TaxID=765440 RepID=A0A0C3BF26_PILCF|nr:hypothetical protein PILCRDRAFT_375032 [Piloderma croceum F 1598]